MTSKDLRQLLNMQEAEYKFLSDKISKLEVDLGRYRETRDVLEEVNKVLSQVISSKIMSVKSKIESLTNQGLSYIFGSSLRIVIHTDFKNNKTLFSLRVQKDNVNEGLVENFGGGVLSVVAFLLKVITVLIAGNQRFMILDESLSMLSEEYQEPMSRFIKQICKDLKFTIVVIAHQPKLSTHADYVYEAKGDAETGVTFVREKTDEYKEL